MKKAHSEEFNKIKKSKRFAHAVNDEIKAVELKDEEQDKILKA